MRMTMAEYLEYEARVKSKKIPAPSTDAEPSERDLHSKISGECRRRGWICFHGSMAHRAMRTIGEPDFTILADGGRVFFIEAKSRLGKLRAEQAATMAWAKKLGHEIRVCRSIDDFLILVK